MKVPGGCGRSTNREEEEGLRTWAGTVWSEELVPMVASGYARTRLGPILRKSCERRKRGTKRHDRLVKRIFKLEEGSGARQGSERMEGGRSQRKDSRGENATGRGTISRMKVLYGSEMVVEERL